MLRRYSEAGKDDQNKESSRSAEKILGSGESTAKIKSPQGVLQESSRVLRRYSEAGKDDQNKESSRSAEKILRSGESTAKIKKVYNFIPY